MSKDASSSPLQLPDDIAALQAIILKEREQHVQVVAQQQATISQLVETNAEYQQSIEHLGHRIAQLLRQQYGPRREFINPAQLTLFTQDELEALTKEMSAKLTDHPTIPDAVLPEEDAKTAKKRRKSGHGRRVLPGHLPREQQLHELTGEALRCPCCGEMRCEFSRESSEQLEYIPPRFKIIEHIRVKYVCQACAKNNDLANIDIAPKPPQPIERGLPGPGLMAYVVLGKYGDHQPLYRLEDQTARFGFTIRRSTLCGWVASAADLVERLVQCMIDRVLQSRIIHTDDTTVQLLEPLLGKTITARFWTYIGDREHPYTVYDFTDSRKRDGPATFLQGFRGYLQADAYGGYDGIFTGSNGTIHEVACSAHARRYWFKAKETDPVRAHHALGVFARLYQIERLCANLSDDERRAFRQQHALPIWREFRTWLDEQAPRLLPKSPIGQAATYTLNQWDALLRYCEDGELSIDNNMSERAVKMQAIGRRNWLFVGSREGGHRAAKLFSLVASCKANRVEPWAYLNDLFTHLPTLPADQPELLDAFLPDRWLATHPQHTWTIDEIRRQERERKSP
jgi:transposase